MILRGSSDGFWSKARSNTTENRHRSIPFFPEVLRLIDAEMKDMFGADAESYRSTRAIPLGLTVLQTVPSPACQSVYDNNFPLRRIVEQGDGCSDG